jgi:hypothetical protein
VLEIEVPAAWGRLGGKMRSMTKLSQTGLLLNGAAVLLIITSVSVVLRSAFVGDQVAPCRERFANAVRFSLESNGEAISAAQMQGELANTDWGLTSGANVVKLTSGPARHVLELDLASAPSVSKDKSAERAGIGFEWAPQSFSRQQAACLNYSVFVPKGFTFGQGGRLPGLLGGSGNERGDVAAGFSTRYTWSADGALDVYAQLPGLGDGRPLGVKIGTFALRPGKWTELEQEVVLNAPGQADGILRVWQDANLVLEKKNLVFRTKPSVALSGVLAEAAAGAAPAQPDRGPQKIRITPFELRWQ